MKYILETFIYLAIIISMPIIFVTASLFAMYNVGRFVIVEYPRIAFDKLYIQD